MRTVRGLRTTLRSSLWDMTPRDHRQSDREFRRRQVVSVVVVARRCGRPRLHPAASSSRPTATASTPPPPLLAGVWAVGAFTSGPLHLGRIGVPTQPDRTPRAPSCSRSCWGPRWCWSSWPASFLIRAVPFLDDNLTPFIQTVLEYAREGNAWVLLLVTVLNGIAEELFFRGAMYAAIRKHQVAITTVAYTVATLATGNVMLGFAAIVLGLIVGLQRRATGGILAPIITHLTWSVSMLYLLPLIFLGTAPT